MTEAEELELLQLKEREAAANPKEPSLLKKGLGAAASALDYAGGLTRTVAANALEPFSENNVVTSEDLVNALKGRAPGTADYLERAGVPEGAKANLFPEITIPGTDIKLGEGETSVRDAAGLVGDIALDPLTYLSLGSSAAAKASLPAKAMSESAGKKLFKSGLKNVDEAMLKKSATAKPLGDLMWEKGGWGSTKSIQDQAEELLQKSGKNRDVMYQMAEEGGAHVDMRKALKGSLEKVNEISNPNLKKLKENLKTKIGNLMDRGEVPISEASQWKTEIRDAMPENAFNKFGKPKGTALKIEQSVAHDIKEGIEQTAEEFMPNLGKNIAKENEIMGSVKGARKPLQQQVERAKKINAVTSVDLPLLGLAVTNPAVGVPLLIGKKAGDISKTTAFRTGSGRVLQKIGKTNLPDYLLRQEIIRQSPWTRMGEKDE